MKLPVWCGVIGALVVAGWTSAGATPVQCCLQKAESDRALPWAGLRGEAPLAGASPYGPWAAEMDRAADTSLTAVAEQARLAPALARVWARGHLADTVDAHLSAPERQVWRGRVEAVATAVDDGALTALLQAPDLAAWVATSAERAERLADEARAGATTGPLIAAVTDGSLAEIVFYSQLFRAGLTLGRPTEPERVESLLAVARHLASGRALILGDLGWYRDLAAWHGAAGVPPGRHDVDLTAFLNGWLRGDAHATARLGEQAVRTAERTGEGVQAVLIQHLGAAYTERSGQAATGRALRIQVLQALRPLGQPRLTGAVLAGLLEVSQGESLVAFAEELQALGPDVTHLPWALTALEAARTQLEGVARNGPPATRSRCQDALVRLTAEGPPERHLAAIELAVADREARGLDAEVAGLLAQAEAAAQGTTPLALARLRVAAARAALSVGEVERARTLAMAAAAPPLALGTQVLGRLRLAEGRLAAAFAHANAGLSARRALDQAPAVAAERSALHSLAVLALHADGQRAAARDRAAFAGRDLAMWAAVAADDLPAALATAEAAPAFSAARRGCLLARMGRAAEALTLLTEAAADPEGQTCRVALLLAAGRNAEAERALNPLRSLANLGGEPTLHWRVLALSSELAHRQGRAVEAAGLARQAVLAWLDLGAERASAGFLLDLHTLALPDSGHDLAAGLPDLLVEAARQDPAGAPAHLRAALAAALLVRRLEAAPERIPFSAAEVPLRTPLARLADLSHRLAEGCSAPGSAQAGAPPCPVPLTGGDRARLGNRMGKVLEEARTARARFALENPAQQAWAWPTLPNPAAFLPPAEEVRLYYHFTPTQGHLWIALPDGGLKHFDLPPAAAITTLLAPARAVLADPEKPFEVEPLQAPLAVLLPDMAVLAGVQSAWVVTDGPLDTFPLEALVLEARGDGGPPVFLASRLALHRARFVAPLPAHAVPPGVAVVGPEGAETEALVAVAGPTGQVLRADPRTLGERFESQGRLVITTDIDVSPALALGPRGADTVVLLHPPAGDRGPLWAALHRRGVKSVVTLEDGRPDDLPFATALTARLAAGEAPADALAALQAAARSTADPATWHPARWARWLQTAPLPVR